MISDREKTAIDCIDRPALAGGVGEAATILAAATRRFDWTKAASYLERIGSGALVRRFGWLADHVQADMPPDIRQQLMHLIGRRTRARLGPAHFKIAHNAIGYDKTWRIFVNVTREELHDSAGLGRRKSIRKDS
jgi:predicted transcriptional regulator of viral defense system